MGEELWFDKFVLFSPVVRYTAVDLNHPPPLKPPKVSVEDHLLLSKGLEESRTKRQNFLSQMNTFRNEVQAGDAATNAAGVVSKSGGDEQTILPTVTPEVAASFCENVTSPPLSDTVVHKYNNESLPATSNVKTIFNTIEMPAEAVVVPPTTKDQKSEVPLDGGLDSLLRFLDPSEQPEDVVSGGVGKYEVFSPSVYIPPTSGRRSLFEDDVLKEEGDVKSFHHSPTVTLSAHSANVPAEYACEVQENPLLHKTPHSGSSSHGIDLEQARHRTTLLMGTVGNSGTPRQVTQVTQTPPSRVPVQANGLHDSSRNPVAQRLKAPGLVDPLSEPVRAPQTSADYYFNDDLLRARVSGGKEDEPSHPVATHQNPSYNIMERVSAVVSATQCAIRPGDGRSAAFSSNTQNNNFDVTFGEGQLGFMLYKAADASGVICRVYPNTMADRNDLRVGDVVKGVNMRDTVYYEDVMQALSQVARPVLVSFYRPNPSNNYRISESGDCDNMYNESTPSQPGDAALKWLTNFADPFIRGSNFDKGSSRGVTPALSSSEEDGSWKVSGDDLLSMRSNFHGTIVHAFEGIFSWSMYGTHEGVDATTGDVFIEYVMRCQWGPDHKTMTPWMVARRYREFSALDKDLHSSFPYLRGTLPCLPPKELFKTSPEVVARRKVGLEQYMTFLITNVPVVLTSEYMDRFLTTSERLMQIRSSLGIRTTTVNQQQQHPGPSLATPVAVARSTSQSPPTCNTTPSLQPWTSQQAHEAYQARGDGAFPPLDSDGLAAVEDLVRELSARVSGLTSAVDLKNNKDLYKLVSSESTLRYLLCK